MYLVPGCGWKRCRAAADTASVGVGAEAAIVRFVAALDIVISGKWIRSVVSASAAERIAAMSGVGFIVCSRRLC